MKLTKKEEKRILVRFIETLVRFGYDISEYIQKPCSHFNMKEVLKSIVTLHQEHGEFNLSGELMPRLKEEFISLLEEDFGQFNNQ
tara:strand:+ start:1114 stop:1368 length:255 start_codon:yes stop_codon:yes gene_type:complete